MAVAVDARPVVHVALQTSAVVTELQEHVRAVLSRLHGPAVVEFTENTTQTHTRLKIHFRNLLQLQEDMLYK